MRFPDNWDELHGGRLQQLVPIAEAAGRSTLAYFGNSELSVESKADASPVTAADRHAEQLVRKKVLESFPQDEVLGEEFAVHVGTTGYRWIVDPIDGTKSFVAGVPLYSTLLALEFNDQPIGGVIFIPALQECVAAAKGMGAWHRKAGGEDWFKAEVSQRKKLSEAIFVTSQVDSFDKIDAQEIYQAIQRQAWITRTWGDGYGYLLVATGRADIMIDPVVNTWDIAAIRPILEEAGGRFSDWSGTPTTRGENAVGTNRKLHKEVMAILTREATQRT